MEQHLDTAAIQAAEDRFDALVTEAEEITGMFGVSGIDHTGGGCLALTVKTPSGTVVATVALDTGYTDYPAWGTEPDVPATEDGPWYVSFFPLDTWHAGPVEAATDDRVPLDRAQLLDYVREHSTKVRERITVEVTMEWESDSDTTSRDDLAREAFGLVEEYLTSPENPFQSDYGRDPNGARRDGWEGPYVVAVGIRRVS